MPPTFELAEQFAFGSKYSWRLKDSEIRFRGTGDYERLVIRRIPASHAQVQAFFSALELIQVWDWRADYDPSDIDAAVDDGSAWMFTAANGARECRCGGVNAYPSYSDFKQTTIYRERFVLLHAALYDCFGIEGYIHEAKRFVDMSSRQSSESEPST